MDTLRYNIRFGYLDALVRARFTEFLTESNYAQLRQCETLEDLRMQLGNAGFQEVTQNDSAKLTPNTIYELCIARMLDRFKFIEVQATDELKEFFVWIRIPYMIDNIVLLISGVVKHRDINELLERCHPLGMFQGIGSLRVASSTEELYHNLLIDTPIGPLFRKCINQNELSEESPEMIRLWLYREYFDGFNQFCEKLGSETATVMKEILAFEADRRAIIITLNSLRTNLIGAEKETLYPKVGTLYPHGIAALARAQSEADIASVLDDYEVYHGLWEQISQNRTIEDIFAERVAQINVDCFSIFFQFGVFYAWTQLMDQEARNVQWIAECIYQNKPEKAENYVRIRP